MTRLTVSWRFWFARLGAIVMAVLIVTSAARAELSTRLLTAMIEDSSGVGVSSGTLIGDGGFVRLVIPERLRPLDATCARFRADGGCYTLSDPVVLPGLGLIAPYVDISLEDMWTEMEPLHSAGNMLPEWIIADTDRLADSEPSWVGQDEFSRWRAPLQPARVSALSEIGFTIDHPDIGSLDEGAALYDPLEGIIGIVASTANGRAGVVASSVLFDAMVAAGFDVSPDQRPTTRLSELPPDVESEIGGIWILNHYPDQDIGFSAFYGPGADGAYGGWGENFDTTVMSQVFSLDAHMRDGIAPPEYLSGRETRQTYGGSGWNLGADYPGATPNVTATCVIHSVPSADDRRVYNLTFWRYRSNISFEQVAFPEKGWADDDAACLTAFARLGDVRGIINGSTDRVDAAPVTTAPAEDDFVLVSDPVSNTSSAIATIGDLVIGVTCGPGDQPFIFYRSASGDAPHVMVDVYRANLEGWRAWEANGRTTFLAPMHPEAARGTVFGAGTVVTYRARTVILMAGQTSSAAETSLAPCL
ncbi:MAG: hypothetical protein V2I76_15210 [Roseobacter sp.]|jgi:hypothetical protein|nr:hypothetical protein [Roseobacter sp.]